MWHFGLSLVLVILGCMGCSIEASTCKREYEMMGCFTRNDKIFKHLLITDLDPTHHKWGQDIDWGDYHASLHSLACRCRTKAVAAGYKWFSLGFYGECWGTSEKKFEADHMSVGVCVNGDHIACDHKLDKECSGIEDNEYVYEVTIGIAPSPTKDLVCPTSNAYWKGTWIKYIYTDTWQECSSACGADTRCYKWDWYPSTYTYDNAFRKRCVFKPDNSVLTPWNHGVFSGLQNCHSGSKAAYMILGPQYVALVKNHLVSTLPVLKKQYEISFHVNPSKWNTNQWGSILHLTTSGNIDKYGARIPGVWFSPWPKSNQNSICTATALSGNLNYHFYSPRVSLNTWSRMKINQVLVGDKYMYRVYLNGKQIHERENTKPQEFHNVKVFLGDPWYPAQPGSIRSVNIRNIRERTLESAVLFQHKTSITKNMQPYTVPLLAKQFDVSFQVYPTSFLKTTWGSNVLHMTTSGNHGHGMRIPGVWFAPNPSGNTNQLHFCFEVNGQVNYYLDTKHMSVKTNEWTSIRITQQLEGSKYMYRIFINGELYNEIENKTPYDFHNVKVFVADPWHDTQPGYIRNLRIQNLGVPSSILKLIRPKSSSVYGGLKTWVASHATDGDPNTFSVTRTEKYAWWEAELEQPAIVKTVQLTLGRYAFSKGYYNGLKIQVARYPADPWSDCTSNLKISAPKGGERAYVQDIKCTKTTGIKYIRLSVSGILYISDVKVQGNAVEEPVLPLINVKSSSTYGNLKMWVPVHAVDGKVDTFSVTKAENPAWWEAELKNPAVIGNFKLILGSYAFRKGYYEGLRVQVRMKPTDPWSNCISGIEVAGPIGSERTFPQEVYCNRPVPSRYLRISITLNQPLYLSEVIVHEKV